MSTRDISAGRCTAGQITTYFLAVAGSVIGIALMTIALQGVVGASNSISFIATVSGGGALTAMSVGWGVLLLIFQRPHPKREVDSRGLYLAISNEDAEAVQQILMRGGYDINKLDEADGSRPLHKAVSKQNTNMVKLLIEAGADVNATDNQGNTPLHYVNTSTMADLLEGADVNIKNKEGTTPLHRAVDHNNAPLTNWLIQHGAQLQVQDNEGNAPLHFVQTMRLAEKFAETGIELRNKAGETPLHTAVRNKAHEVIDWLLEKKHDVDVSDNWGNTPLHLAPSAREAERLKCANVNAVNHEGETPLHLAARNGNESVVRWLFQQNAVYNAKDNQGRTPLDCAEQESDIYSFLNKLISEKESKYGPAEINFSDDDGVIDEEKGWILPDEDEEEKLE